MGCYAHEARITVGSGLLIKNTGCNGRLLASGIRLSPQAECGVGTGFMKITHIHHPAGVEV